MGLWPWGPGASWNCESTMHLIGAVFIAVGVMVLLLIITVVHFVSGPLGPFVGGFIGIGKWRNRPESEYTAGVAFGFALWLMLALVAAVVIVILNFITGVISGGTGALVIGGVVGGVFYITILATAGAIVSASRVKGERDGSEG